MKKGKFYAVRSGREPGIYLSWAQCEAQVKGHPNAAFKSFSTREEAEKYISGDFGNGAALPPLPDDGVVDIYVDGSYRAGRYSWGYAAYEGGTLLHADKGVGLDQEAAAIRNVAGELEATVQAVNWAEEKGLCPVRIHHDYSGISAWAEGSWQAKNKFTQAYAAFMRSRIAKVRFVKVAGHTGVEGNEMADQLAKAALDEA